jgi:hypothetical protein
MEKFRSDIQDPNSTIHGYVRFLWDLENQNEDLIEEATRLFYNKERN